MFCPRCGQPQQNSHTRFCSHCGFLMTGMEEVVANGGLPKAVIENKDPNAISPRKRGLKQGALLFLSGFIIVPLAVMLSIIFRVEPFGAVAAAIFTFLAGFLWMLYSLVFQSSVPNLSNDSIVETIKYDLTGKKKRDKALPPKQSEPIPDIFQPSAGNWRETADLHPNSVTEETTRTLNKKFEI